MGLWDHRCYFASKDGSVNGDGSEENPFDLLTLLANLGRCKTRIELTRSAVPASGYWKISDMGIESPAINYDDDLAAIASKLGQWCGNVPGLEFVGVEGGPLGVDVLYIDLIVPFDEWQAMVRQFEMAPFGVIQANYRVLQVKCKGAVKAGMYDEFDLGGFPCIVMGGNAVRNEVRELIGYDEHFDTAAERGDLDELEVLGGVSELGKYDSVVVAGFLSSGREVLGNAIFDEWLNDEPVVWSVAGEDATNIVSQNVDGAEIVSPAGTVILSQEIDVAGVVRIDLGVLVTAGSVRLKVRHTDGTFESLSGSVASSGSQSFYCMDIDQVIIEAGSSCDVVLQACYVFEMDGPRGVYDWYGNFSSESEAAGFLNGMRVYRSRETYRCSDGSYRRWALWYEGSSGSGCTWRLTAEEMIGLQPQDGWFWHGDREGWDSLFYPDVAGRTGLCQGDAVAAPTIGHVDRMPVVDGWASDADMFDIAGECNLSFRNLHLTNMQSAGEGNLVDSSGYSYVSFAGCAFTCAARAVGGSPTFSILNLSNCYLDAISNNLVTNLQTYGKTIVSACVFNVGGNRNAVQPTGSLVFDRNLVLNASRVINPVGLCDLVYLSDNTIVGVDTCVVTMWYLCRVIERGNIFKDVLRVFWWNDSGQEGAVIGSGRSCLHNGTYAHSDNSQVNVPGLPANYCLDDPRLLNFVPQNSDIARPYEMGAIKLGRKFRTRSMTANPGRMSVIR